MTPLPFPCGGKGHKMAISERILSNRFQWRLCAVVITLLCLAGCASLKAAGGHGEEGRSIWKVRDQFVNVVPREQGSNPNEHPAELSPNDLHRTLASVYALAPDTGESSPLFTETELKVLEDAGVKALRQAGPGEDVTFAVYGYHATLQGLLKETKVTTGRMFFQDGRLNLILGIVRRDVMDTEDRRLNPFTPGSRLRPAAMTAHIKEASGGVPFTMKRQDWLVFAPVSAAPPAVESPKPRPEPVSPAAASSAPRQEQKPVAERPVATEPKGVEERLTILKNLREKGLITEEEFRAKRAKILDEL